MRSGRPAAARTRRSEGIGSVGAPARARLCLRARRARRARVQATSLFCSVPMPAMEIVTVAPSLIEPMPIEVPQAITSPG